DPDPPGELAQGAEQDLRARRPREPGEEVVLHEPEVVESDRVGEHALLDRLLVERVPLDARALERSLRLIEQPESHGRWSFQIFSVMAAAIKPARLARGGRGSRPARDRA